MGIAKKRRRTAREMRAAKRMGAERRTRRLPDLRCPKTRKRKYTVDQAERALAIARGSGAAEVPVRHYRCEFCGSTHLTSQPPRTIQPEVLE